MRSRASRICRNFGILFALMTLYLAFLIPSYRDAGIRQSATVLGISCAAASVLSFVAAVVARRR